MTDGFESPDEVADRQLKLQLRLAQLERIEAYQNNFMTFVRAMWPEFIAGKHHRLIAEKLEAVANGKLKRLIVNMPPRHTKSEFASFLFPAWMVGRNPAMKIIQATHTTELAVGFGRKIKRFFLNRVWPPTRKLVEGGILLAAVCIMLSVLAVIWLVAVLIYVLSTIPTLNRLLCRIRALMMPGIGTPGAPDNVSSRVER
jgi:hypothetical protein